MKSQILTKEYEPKLDFFLTQKAIKLIKDSFERKLAEKLKLLRVSAPRFLKIGKGLQDDLAGTQIPVSFKAKFTDKDIEMVHSLAKWKRFILGKHGFKVGQGLYTDMDAVRKDEDISPIHSIYVDQWDWEKVISKEQRTLRFLRYIVRKIYEAILETESLVEKQFKLKAKLPKKIKFIHSEELEKLYPDLTPDQREYKIAEKYGAVFLIGIGADLKSGKPHDVRAADYDDWELDGDIIVWDYVGKRALELTSMGIRVDKTALLKQLKIMKQEHRKKLEYHKGIIKDKIPLSIGGGIGQSRLCMLLLQKAHIGEVQSSAWPSYVEKEFKEKRVALL